MIEGLSQNVSKTNVSGDKGQRSFLEPSEESSVRSVRALSNARLAGYGGGKY
jgi:hypothetical protein